MNAFIQLHVVTNITFRLVRMLFPVWISLQVPVKQLRLTAGTSADWRQAGQTCDNFCICKGDNFIYVASVCIRFCKSVAQLGINTRGEAPIGVNDSSSHIRQNQACLRVTALLPYSHPPRHDTARMFLLLPTFLSRLPEPSISSPLSVSHTNSLTLSSPISTTASHREKQQPVIIRTCIYTQTKTDTLAHTCTLND